MSDSKGQPKAGDGRPCRSHQLAEGTDERRREGTCSRATSA